MKRVSGHALTDYRRLLSAIAATVSIAFVLYIILFGPA